jgi:hypothetical protein
VIEEQILLETGMSETSDVKEESTSAGVNQATEKAAEDFTAKQQIALQALAAGSNVTRAAFAAGVTRQTINRWRKENPAFNAAIKAWILQTKRSAETMLVELVEEAVASIGEAVGAGDGYLGLQLLRSMGVVRGAAIRFAEKVRKQSQSNSTPPGGEAGGPAVPSGAA